MYSFDNDRLHPHGPIIGSNVYSGSSHVGDSYVLNVGHSSRPSPSISPSPQGSAPDQPVVFINFRTGDEEASATLIERELSSRFGSNTIFRAEKSVRAGDDIETVIIDAVRRSSAVVAVIGPRWLWAVDAQGRRALHSEHDWTRRELVEARAHGVRVIPVLIGSTPSLDPDDLPPALGWLANCKYLRLNYRDVDGGLARLADQLAKLVPGLAGRMGADRPANPVSSHGDG